MHTPRAQCPVAFDERAWFIARMKKAMLRAIENISNHGDTDIFPYPIENRILFDMKNDIVGYLLTSEGDFEKFINDYPPFNYGTLAPVGYTGFRWATQIDPLWNVYYLALVISISDKIEKARISSSSNRVFSYRFCEDIGSSDIFNREYGWRKFTENAILLAEKYKYVVSCDISEFYPRVNHHRLDNALRQLDSADTQRNRIMAILSNFSETYSFGLPVGGPASRILSELTLNQIDRLLNQKRIEFCRFADDYYIFSDDHSSSFKSLVYLSEILQRNQGLQLQKAKTRIMKSTEFLSTNPLSMDVDFGTPDTDLNEARRRLFAFSLHFDPYSPSAQEDYANLKSEMRKFPIVDMLKAELTKTRVNISLSRKLIQTLKFISDEEIEEAVITLIEKEDLLYPLYYNVMLAVKSEFCRLSDKVKIYVSNYIIDLIENKAPSMSIDLNLQYAVRLIAEYQSEEAMATLVQIYDSTNSHALKSDIILIMTKWRNWTWLSDRRAYFRSMTPPERRAYIIASYSLKDEGKHWRSHTVNEFSPFEKITQKWASERFNKVGWEIPL